ncbi:MAG: TetR/AcrR family transcriptional regulator [Proteobacteria bacterium]|nr:TetR/AcrR family transcriptional regulator [Pseudomonadota bacterium]
MNQKENRKQQIDKVLFVSKHLFITQGYEKTTMRQIIDAAGMTTGSLYNFFGSKEDILLQLIRDLFTDVPDLADEIVTESDNPLLRISLELSIYFYAIEFAPNLSGLYISTFKSYPAAKLIAHIEAKRASSIIGPYLKGSNYMDYYLRNMAIIGTMQKLLEEREYGDLIFQFEQMLSFLARHLILIYELPFDIIDEIIEQTLEMINRPDVQKKIKALIDYWLNASFSSESA